MKTQVEIIQNINQCNLKKGDVGYIDGYCRAGDDRGYAVVVCGEKLDFVPTYALKVLGLK